MADVDKRTYVGIDKTGSVVLMRVMKRDDVRKPIPARYLVSRIDALISSNNIRELLLAIDDLPPIIPCERIEEYRIQRVLDPKDFNIRRYSACDAFTLEYQAHFDAGVPSEEEDRIRSTNWAVDHRNVFPCDSYSKSDGFAVPLKEAGSAEGYSVIVEPLDDWVFARNVLGFTARIIGLINSGEDEVLTRAGMKHRYNDLLGSTIYRIPFSFNPFFIRPYANKYSLGAQWRPRLFRPLVTLTLGEPKKRRSHKLSVLDSIWAFSFNDDDDVYMLTDPNARDDRKLRRPSKVPVEERRYWLCVEDDGRPQCEIARHVATSMVERVRLLRADGENLGWEYDSEAYLNHPYPQFIAKSVFSQMMYRIAYRDKVTITNCRECGNAILDSVGGRPRVFCSQSCRLKNARRLKKEEEIESGAREVLPGTCTRVTEVLETDEGPYIVGDGRGLFSQNDYEIEAHDRTLDEKEGARAGVLPEGSDSDSATLAVRALLKQANTQNN